MLVLDHFFILVEPGAAEGALLKDIGMTEGPSNSHPGQGTANRRFVFANSMLELLYVRDAAEALAGPGSRLNVVQRTSEAGASPFGFVVSGGDETVDLPFAGWRYYPDYFGGDRYFLVADNSDLLTEPLCVMLPAGIEVPPRDADAGYPFSHVTALRLESPVRSPTSALSSLGQLPGFTLARGGRHRLLVTFNDGRQGRVADLQPRLPLVLCW